jgi:hypothetical protein
MVSSVGWVALRRGILQHLQEGRLSNTEALALVVLILLADKGTGAGTINAPCLRYFIPGLSSDAAKRALQSLQEKGYIFRDIKRLSVIAYPYWVNRYVVTDGRHKALQTDISRALETKDPKDIRYVPPAPEGAPEGALEGALPTAHYYKNRESINKNRENSIVAKVNASLNSTNERKLSDKPYESKITSGIGVCASGKGSLNDEQSVPAPSGVPQEHGQDVTQTDEQGDAARGKNLVSTAAGTLQQTRVDSPPRQQKKVDEHFYLLPRNVSAEQAACAGLRWSGYDGAFINVRTGSEVSHDDAKRLIVSANPEVPLSDWGRGVILGTNSH